MQQDEAGRQLAKEGKKEIEDCQTEEESSLCLQQLGAQTNGSVTVALVVIEEAKNRPVGDVYCGENQA
jgi:hypothetical protein